MKLKADFRVLKYFTFPGETPPYFIDSLVRGIFFTFRGKVWFDNDVPSSCPVSADTVVTADLRRNSPEFHRLGVVLTKFYFSRVASQFWKNFEKFGTKGFKF